MTPLDLDAIRKDHRQGLNCCSRCGQHSGGNTCPVLALADEVERLRIDLETAKETLALVMKLRDAYQADLAILRGTLEMARQQSKRHRTLLGRIRQWDHLDSAGDGEFWKSEIDFALADPQPPTPPEDEEYVQDSECVKLTRKLNETQGTSGFVKVENPAPVLPEHGLSSDEVNCRCGAPWPHEPGLPGPIHAPAPPQPVVYSCPVCDFGRLERPPKDWYICPRCGIEFGYDDVNIENLREQWRSGRHFWPAPPSREETSHHERGVYCCMACGELWPCPTVTESQK